MTKTRCGREDALNYKELQEFKAKLAHRQKPKTEWTHTDTAKEFGLAINSHVNKVGKSWRAIRQMQVTHVKRTVTGLRYLEQSCGMTPKEAAEYIPDFIERLGNRPLETHEPAWVEFLMYAQVRGLARRGKSTTRRAERSALRARIFYVTRDTTCRLRY
jgi:hypothetical protein